MTVQRFIYIFLSYDKRKKGSSNSVPSLVVVNVRNLSAGFKWEEIRLTLSIQCFLKWRNCLDEKWNILGFSIVRCGNCHLIVYLLMNYFGVVWLLEEEKLRKTRFKVSHVCPEQSSSLGWSLWAESDPRAYISHPCSSRPCAHPPGRRSPGHHLLSH